MKMLFIAILFSSATAFGQQHKMTGNSTSGKFTTFNRTVNEENEGGSTVIKLNEVEGPGIAWIKEQQFAEGTIEFEAKGKDVFQRSFVGIAFHGINDTTYEAVYFRPFNFKATDPVRKLHAVQYIANPQFDWPRLRTDFLNQYEKPVNPSPDPDQWFHVRIEVREEMISVFVNDNTSPVLTVKPLVELGGKMIGYWAGSGSAGKWKNLKITAVAK